MLNIFQSMFFKSMNCLHENRYFYHLSYDYLEEALKQSYKNVKTNEFLIAVPVTIVIRHKKLFIFSHPAQHHTLKVYKNTSVLFGTFYMLPKFINN